MLHIVTPLFRYDLLEQVYRTIPAQDDIVWHIAKTSRRPTPEYSFLRNDRRIRFYEIDCADSDIVAKRNAMFAHIDDGYFFLLDDDTICLEEMYRVYREYSAAGFVGMIVGGNNLCRAVAPSSDPRENLIDTGAVICHHAVLKQVRWAWSAEYARDRYFWSRCFDYFGRENTLVLNRTISSYNYFGPLVRVRKTFLSFKIECDIRNLWMAKGYLLAARAKHHCGRLTRRVVAGRATYMPRRESRSANRGR